MKNKLLILIALFALAFGLYHFSNRKSRVAVPPAPTPTPSAVLSNDEKLAFYERELKPVAEVLHNGTISFPLLKVEHTRLKNAIFARYQKLLESSAALNLHPDDKPGFLAAPFITPAGHPLVTLYVPEAVVLFDMLKKDGSPTWRARFTNDVMVAYFHELHHLELGHPLENVGKGISLEHERSEEHT